MKRNMGLVRKTLFKVEAYPAPDEEIDLKIERVTSRRKIVLLRQVEGVRGYPYSISILLFHILSICNNTRFTGDCALALVSFNSTASGRSSGSVR
jgi:hypothetical protein